MTYLFFLFRSSTGYGSSPLSSPFSFSSMSLDSSRKLPHPSENTLGLKGLRRESSAEYSLRNIAAAAESGDRSTQSNTLPSPTLLRTDSASRSPISRQGENKSSGLMLPPLSELTRGLEGWRPDNHTSSRHYSISQDRKQTELLDFRLVRGERLMSF